MQQSETIRRIALDIYEALNTHDETVVKDYFDSGPDHVMVGTLAHEVFHGSDAVLGLFRDQFRETPELHFEPGQIESHVNGDVAWLFDQPTISAPGVSDQSARLTVVLARVDGRWVVVHSHLSLPSDLD